MFIEYGNQARIATWQLFVRRAGDSGRYPPAAISSVDNLYRLTLNTAKQYDARNLSITAGRPDADAGRRHGLHVDTDQGVTGLVLHGPRRNAFRSAPGDRGGQVRIFAGSEATGNAFDAAFVRVGTADRTSTYRAGARPVDPRDLKRAEQLFREESAEIVRRRSRGSDARHLDACSPDADDFLAEMRTRRFNTLTYARSASEPEDISLFERRRKEHRDLRVEGEAAVARAILQRGRPRAVRCSRLRHRRHRSARPAMDRGRAKMHLKVRRPLWDS